MSMSYDEVEFGADLPQIQPDVSLANVQRFCRAAHMEAGRFMSHEDARKEGLPQAIVPGMAAHSYNDQAKLDWWKEKPFAVSR